MAKNLALAVALILNVLLLMIGVVLYQASSIKPSKSPTLNHDGLLAIQVNRGCDQVIREIGFPIEIAAGGARSIEPSSHSGRWPGRYRWIYSRPGWPEGLSVVVGISDCQVAYVSAKDGDQLLYLATERGVEVKQDDLLAKAMSDTNSR